MMSQGATLGWNTQLTSQHTELAAMRKHKAMRAKNVYRCFEPLNFKRTSRLRCFVFSSFPTTRFPLCSQLLDSLLLAHHWRAGTYDYFLEGADSCNPYGFPKRFLKRYPKSDGLQHNSNGLQPTSDEDWRQGSPHLIFAEVSHAHCNCRGSSLCPIRRIPQTWRTEKQKKRTSFCRSLRLVVTLVKHVVSTETPWTQSPRSHVVMSFHILRLAQALYNSTETGGRRETEWNRGTRKPSKGQDVDHLYSYTVMRIWPKEGSENTTLKIDESTKLSYKVFEECSCLGYSVRSHKHTA